MVGSDTPLPDAGAPPPGGGPGRADVGALKTMWRRVYQKAAQAGEERTRALLDEHRFRQHGRRSLAVVLDGGGAALTAGEKCDLELPWAYQLEAWALYADQIGSLVVDLQTATDLTAYPTTASICGGAPPTLTSAQKARSEDLSAWSPRALPQGTVLRVRVNSAATITLATLTLHLRAV